MKRDELRKLTRDELLVRAEALGVARPAVLTQGELIDEIVKRASPSGNGLRGWLGRARDLVAQVVSKGLHVPEAARLFRGEAPEPLPPPPPPLPTVTLAEIYAAQGHVEKAITVLDQVIELEPSHPVAYELRRAWLERLEGRGAAVAPKPSSDDGSGTATAEAAAPDRASTRSVVAEPPSTEPSEKGALPEREGSSEVRVDDDAAAADVEAAGADGATASAPATEARELETAGDKRDERSDLPTFQDVAALTSLDETSASLAWELRPVRYARALAREPGGSLVVRVFSAHPEGSAVRTSTTDSTLEGSSGAVSITGLSPGAHVRACVAWKSGDSFDPLVVASALTMPTALS